MCQYLSEIRY